MAVDNFYPVPILSQDIPYGTTQGEAVSIFRIEFKKYIFEIGVGLG
jgi:hypothetical protein